MEKYIFSIIILYINYYILFKAQKRKTISRTKAITKGKYFIKKCIEGSLINNNTSKNQISSVPKISVIIPVYNCESTLKATIRSIQNQDMSDIEIILVNDFSFDNSTKIMDELSKEDNRIKIINNDKNMGTFYTRNIGILNSKGIYILNLDNDDLFIDNDVFDVVYKEAEKGDFDILGFGAIDSPNYDPIITQTYDDYFHKHQDGLIVFQPELSLFPYTKNNNKFEPNDYHVWGRLVKSSLYKKVINNLGYNAIEEDRNKVFLCWDEDTAISIVLFRFAQSYRFIQKYGIFHYISRETASFTRHNEENFYGQIFVLDMMYDFTDNSYNGKKYIKKVAEDLSNSKFYTLNNERNFLYLKAVINKILNSQFITEQDKKKIFKLYEHLL